MFDYLAGREDWFAHDLPMEGEDADEPRAGDRIERDVPTCGSSEPIGVVRERAKAAGWDACVVVNEQRIVLGLLGPYEFGADDEACVETVMEPGPSTSRPHAPLSDLREYFEKQQRAVAVITTSDGVLLGLLRRSAT